MTTKTCTRCKQPRPADTATFKPDGRMKDGLSSWCRACFKQNDKDRQLKRRKSDKLGRPPKLIIDGKLTCGTCKLPQPATDEFFARDSATPTGFRARCKTCDSKAARMYYRENRQQRIDNASAWNEAHPEERRQAKAKSDKQCRLRLRAYFKEKRSTDIQFRLGMQLRIRLAGAVRAQIARGSGAKRGASAVRDLGCTIGELMEQLEQQFQPGMSWNNYGEWHIDHRKPLASFDLTDAEQCRAACHFSNLQPLWAEDNLKKGGR